MELRRGIPAAAIPRTGPAGRRAFGVLRCREVGPAGAYTHRYHDPGQIVEIGAGLAASYRSEPTAAHGGAGCLPVSQIVAHPDHPAPGVALGHYRLWLAELEGPKIYILRRSLYLS